MGLLLNLGLLLACVSQLGSAAGQQRKLMSPNSEIPEYKQVGFGGEKILGFMDYLSEESKLNIQNFDRLSIGLNITVEDFFVFVNNLVETNVPDTPYTELNSEAEEVEEDEFLTTAQLGELFGGVNASAVDYILETLNVTSLELHEAFNTVDIIMVLMYITSHFESEGINVTILDIITSFCWGGRFTVMQFPGNLAAITNTHVQKIARIVKNLEGSLRDVEDYIEEIMKPDTCRLLDSPMQSVAKRSLRGKDNMYDPRTLLHQAPLPGNTRFRGI